MILGFDQPWFLLLWIVALGILLLPIIVGGVNAIVNNYFQAKEKHAIDIVKLVAKAVVETIENRSKKKGEASDEGDIGKRE